MKTDAEIAVPRIIYAVSGIDGNDAIVALTHALCEVAARHFSKSSAESIATTLGEQIDDLIPEYIHIARGA